MRQPFFATLDCRAAWVSRPHDFRKSHDFLLFRALDTMVAARALPKMVRGDTLILLTDGVRPPSIHEITLSSPPKQLAAHILAKYGKGTDDALVLVARYVGNGP